MGTLTSVETEKTPKDYGDWIFTDVFSGDHVLKYPPEGRRCEETWDGMVFEVETRVVGKYTLWPEWPESDPRGKLVIDIVETNCLLKLNVDSPDEVRSLLKKYEERLIPLLEKGGEKDKVDKFYKNIGEFTDFVVNNLENIWTYMGFKGNGSPIFAYFKNGHISAVSDPPTLMYMAFGLHGAEFKWGMAAPKPRADDEDDEDEEEEEEEDEYAGYEFELEDTDKEEEEESDQIKLWRMEVY